jgi:hemin uptake protein HemP
MPTREATPLPATRPMTPSGTPNAPQFSGDRPLISEQLLGASNEVKIQHNGELYSLRRTRLNKLILTK